MNSFATHDDRTRFSHTTGERLPVIYENLEEGSLLVEVSRSMQAMDDYVLALIMRFLRIVAESVAAANDQLKVAVETGPTKEETYDSFVDAMSHCV
jgi:hypothetical protein